MKGDEKRARPSKPVSVLQFEKRSHRTNAEIKQREKAEKAVLSGSTLTESVEVKNNIRAHKEFLRLKKLFNKIGKNDDLYSAVLNRYCILFAECAQYQKDIEDIENNIRLLEEMKDDNLAEYVILTSKLTQQKLSIDRQLQTKRKMMLDIEKENVMTIAAALRSVPKTPEKKRNLLEEALNG